jgi:hypothetical protein
VDIDATGMSECCDAPTFCGRTGLVLGGEARWAPEVAGLVLGGGAGFAAPPLRGAGALRLGGVSGFSGAMAFRGGGGLAIDGRARIPPGMAQIGAGGLVIDGAATQEVTVRQRALGGLVIDGAADQRGPWPRPGQRSGLVLGGSAAQFVTTQQRGSGALRLGGSASQEGGYRKPFVVSYSTFAGSASGGYTHPGPEGAAAGDLLVWWVMTDQTPGGTALTPDGWYRGTEGSLTDWRRFFLFTANQTHSPGPDYYLPFPEMTHARGMMARVRAWHDTWIQWPFASGYDTNPYTQDEATRSYGSLLMTMCWWENLSVPTPPHGWGFVGSVGTTNHWGTLAIKEAPVPGYTGFHLWPGTSPAWYTQMMLVDGPAFPPALTR